MAYLVVLADSARADANQIYDWVTGMAPVRGPEWFEELIDSIYSLEEMPYRCPLAREARASSREIRCLLFGKRKNQYRILYEIDEVRQRVWILHVRHGAQSEVAADEIAWPE